MAIKIQRRSMQTRLKFVHSYQTYNVDLFHTNENLSTTMNIQCGSMLGLIQNTPSQPRERNEHLTYTQGIHLVLHKVRIYPCDYNVLT